MEVINLKIIIIAILFPVFLTAQVNDSLDFFPHHVGDIWQYISYPDGSFTELRITKIDTNYNNNSLYNLLFYNNNSTWGYRINLDSGIVYIPESNFPWYKLNVDVGTIWTREPMVEWVKYWDDSQETWNGINLNTKIYYNYYGNEPDSLSDYAGSADILARGIGILRHQWEGGKNELIGCIINGKKYGTILSEIKEINTLPEDFILKQKYPNPFNPSTTIEYSVPANSNITIKIFNILGKEVRTLLKGYQQKGKHKIIFSACNLSTGVYFYTLYSNSRTVTKHLLLLK